MALALARRSLSDTDTSWSSLIWAKCYKPFYGRKLQLFVIS